VLAVVMVALILVACGGAVVVGTAVIARHRAQAAADLAALAAAGRLAAGQEVACGWAAALAQSMHAVVAECVVRDLDVIVTVDVSVPLTRWGTGTARAAARAGPG
jgi:secretion/DNA translocation related TadE-like protein